jgi:hypothetical protein
MTKALRLISGMTLDRVTGEILVDVFEELWAAIGRNYADDPRTIDETRVRLATIVLALAKDGQLSPLQIMRTASRLMRQRVPREIRADSSDHE